MVRHQHRKIVAFLSVFLLVAFVNAAHSDITPEEAREVARNYVGNPNLFLTVRVGEDGDELMGIRRAYELEGEFLSFTVDKATGRLISYGQNYKQLCLDTPSGTPVLDDETLVTRAREYAVQVCPDFAQFQWEARDLSRTWWTYQGRRAQNFRVLFVPYVINAQGKRVLFAANTMTVVVNSHTGQLQSFSYFPVQLSVTDLTPTVTQTQAEQAVAQYFFARGAARVTPMMSVVGYWDFETLPDGLVIAADDLGQQRLLWVFDLVETEGQLGFEEQFGAAGEPFWFWGAVDAHTGNFYLLGSYLGGNSKALLSKQPKRPTTFEAKGSNKISRVIIPRVIQGDREIRLFGGVKVEGREVQMSRGIVEKLLGVRVVAKGGQGEVMLADGRRIKGSMKGDYLLFSQIANPLGIRLTWRGNEVLVVYPERTEQPVKGQKPQGLRRAMGFTTFFALAFGCSVVAYTVYATTRKKPLVTKSSTSAKADS
ncbi:MAG: hypothetical protein NZT92_03030 [Abditibacteriales bacterium]|nr:hypothetical protein [Abditibacteriales bacterium]